VDGPVDATRAAGPLAVLLVAADGDHAETLAASLRELPQPIAVEIATDVAAALERLTAPGLAGAVIDVAHPAAEADAAIVGLARGAAPDLAIIALVDASARGAADAIVAGADACVREDHALGESLVANLRAAQRRRLQRDAARLRVLYISRAEPVRDPAFMARADLVAVVPKTGEDTALSHLTERLQAFHAVVIDLSAGATDLLMLLQDAVTRAPDRAVIVLTDAGDRALVAAAMRLGADQVIAKQGVWPLRLLAALDCSVAGRRVAADAEGRRGTDHAALKAHLDAAAREAELLRVQLGQLEAERQAFDERRQQQIAALETTLARTKAEAAAALDEARAEIRASQAAMSSLAEAQRGRAEDQQDASMKTPAEDVGAPDDRDRDVFTLCAALDTAEQTRAALVAEHESELRAIRGAFAERETAQTLEIASLRAEVASLRAAATLAVAAGPAGDREPHAPGALADDSIAVASAFAGEIAARLTEVRRLLGSALSSTQDQHAEAEHVREALIQATRGQDVAEQFQAFARTRTLAKSGVSLAHHLAALRPAFEEIVGIGIGLTVDPAPESLHAAVPREALSRALLALVGAAARALPLGGRVGIRVVGSAEAGSPGQPAATLRVTVSGFGRRPLANIDGIEAPLSDCGASLKILGESDPPALELTVPVQPL
jgi:DNA-binding NarL/FixJ family response regulator